jgi:DNA polymerase-3 subunit beta
MENKISFNPKWLKAAAMIAARHDIRYYLNGVLVEVFDHEARLVATDGHRMLFLRKLVEGCAPFRFIVSTEIFDLLKPQPKHPRIEATFTYDPETPAAKVVLDYMNVGIQFKPIDGVFPNYSQTMSSATKPSGAPSTINVTYLNDFKRVLDCAFGPDKLYTPSVWHNGEGPAAVTYKDRDDFFGIVMPMRTSTAPFKPPVWTLPLPEEKKQPEEALAA